MRQFLSSAGALLKPEQPSLSNPFWPGVKRNRRTGQRIAGGKTGFHAPRFIHVGLYLVLFSPHSCVRIPLSPFTAKVLVFQVLSNWSSQLFVIMIL